VTQRWPLPRGMISWRMKLRKLPEPEKYYQLLGTETPKSHLEWKELTVLLTTDESYFFRDKGLFALL
jgi:chemotaxis protein methyltransferase CheR